jgi:hypothetical protein
MLLRYSSATWRPLRYSPIFKTFHGVFELKCVIVGVNTHLATNLCRYLKHWIMYIAIVKTNEIDKTLFRESIFVYFQILKYQCEGCDLLTCW